MRLGTIINMPVFIVSLCLGLLFVYLSNPPPTIIYVYPTPENVDKIHYVDKANNCFKFNSQEVSCLGNNIKSVPIQK
tara:strand:- start:7716 stop:7946 length:231 start_codon:yes stop_codon:yes gene_type:complete